MMIAMPGSPMVEITLQQSSLATSSKAFMLQIREHYYLFSSVHLDQAVQVHPIARVITCLQVRFNDAHQCTNRDSHAPAAVQPRGNHSRAGTSLWPYEHLSIPMQSCS
jgi:hypothetical protein